MKKILVIGASGKVGKILTQLLHGNGLSVLAMVRCMDKAKSFIEAGISVVEGDLKQDFTHVFKDCEKIIFSAGSGAHTSAEQTLLIDLWAACKVIDKAKINNIKHFIMVSSRGADNPDNGPIAIKPYLVAKHFADQYLINSGLNYTILRPGRLLDEKGTGYITTSRPQNPEQQIISREDTAQAVFHCLNTKTTAGKIFELYKGGVDMKKALGV